MAIYYHLGYHNVTNGCTRLFPRDVTSHPGNEKHAVRCCNNNELTCMSPRPCQLSKTFEEAQSICAQNGLSLCSNNEILKSICCKTGCEIDSETMWIADSQPCTKNSWFYVENLLDKQLNKHDLFLMSF